MFFFQFFHIDMYERKWELYLFLFPTIPFPSDFKRFFFIICKDYYIFPLDHMSFFLRRGFICYLIIFTIILARYLAIYGMFHYFLNLKQFIEYQFFPSYLSSLCWFLFNQWNTSWFPEVMHILKCLSLPSYLPVACPDIEFWVHNIFPHSCVSYFILFSWHLFLHRRNEMSIWFSHLFCFSFLDTCHTFPLFWVLITFYSFCWELDEFLLPWNFK